MSENSVSTLKVERWRAHWSRQAVSLDFANTSSETSVKIAPDLARTLATDLANSLNQYETIHGTLWSEDHQRLGEVTDARLGLRTLIAKNVQARHIYQLVRNLPLSGFERSFKMLDGQLWRDRFLVGFSTRSLCLADLRSLVILLDAPATFQQAIQNQLADANFIHIGFEGSAEHNLCKFYLEFPSERPSTVPLYLGYKWNMQNKEQHTLSRYTPPKAHSLETLLQKIAEIYSEANTEIFRVTEAILRRAESLAPVSELLFVEVREDGTPRISFDINLYPTALRINDIQDEMDALQQIFGVSSTDYSELLAEVINHVVGHISGGIDRRGKPFFTTYHTQR